MNDDVEEIVKDELRHAGLIPLNGYDFYVKETVCNFCKETMGNCKKPHKVENCIRYLSEKLQELEEEIRCLKALG